MRRVGCAESALINTARGAIVEEKALARVLAEGALGGAGRDVFAEEPRDGDSPLRRLDNVVLTSHLGWPALDLPLHGQGWRASSRRTSKAGMGTHSTPKHCNTAVE
jgi:D-isomer specific 2-hydroxyacid dehydrogenase-like protein